MFETVDKRLETWAKEVFDDLKISFDEPGANKEKPSLCLYLLEVFAAPTGRGARLPPLQVTLRYLVVPQGTASGETHQLLGTLLISAMQHAELEVEKTPPPLELWRAFGIAPRPAFTLLVPFKHERTEKIAAPVREPLTIKKAVLKVLRGQVTINRLPLTNARVEIPQLKLFTETDADGNFRFAAIPSEPTDKNLLIQARGREFAVTTAAAERNADCYLFDLKWEE